MKRLRKLLVRVFYWRHELITVHVDRYIGGARGEFWCTRCGGTVHAVARHDGPHVTSSSCPVGREYMRIDPP